MKAKSRPELSRSPILKEIPIACHNELAAVEFFEKQRWGEHPCCVKCGSLDVYKMTGKGPQGRNHRFLWRCRDCKKQYTVRIGTVYEESRIPLRHWCFAFWAACSSKKGVSALQIMRQTGITYKSALFLMNRIRFAMAPDHGVAAKLQGTVEADETYVGGKPRKGDGKVHRRGRGTSKTPVFAVVERGGPVRACVMATVNGANVRSVLEKVVDLNSWIITDEFSLYRKATPNFFGHETVNHGKNEYVRGDIHTNTIEGFFSIVKRGLIGIYHAVSKEHLHRYLSEFEFRYNSRKLNDGDRTVLAIRSAEGKRLMYRQP